MLTLLVTVGVLSIVIGLVVFALWIDRRHQRAAWRAATIEAHRAVYGRDPGQRRES